MNLWHQVKGWAAVVTAFIACPCHLPITLPIILSLTAGTALGAWIADNRDLLVALLTLYFLGGLALGFYWLNKEEKPAARPSRAGSRAVKPRPGAVAARRR